MTKPPILSIEQREELRKAALGILERAPGSKFMFLDGCLSLIAELEIKDAIIAQIGERKDTRCGALAPMASGMYRCVLEARDGHTEHQYNYFRSLTKQEQEEWFPENKG